MSTIHLTNHSSRSQHGPGPLICAMAVPRSWEQGDGRCGAATPRAADLLAVKRGALDIAEYRELCAERWRIAGAGGCYQPGRLSYVQDGRVQVVPDGATLFCACARPGSSRRTHPCHLEWLAPILASAGWRVVLYGANFEPEI